MPALLLAVFAAASAGLVPGPTTTFTGDEYDACVVLNTVTSADEPIKIYWALNATHAAIAVETPVAVSPGWVGVGVSLAGPDQSAMTGSDLVVFSDEGVFDFFAASPGAPSRDSVQSVALVSAVEVCGVRVFRFTKLLDAEGPPGEDASWRGDNVTLLAALGPGPLEGSGESVSFSAALNHGLHRAKLRGFSFATGAANACGVPALAAPPEPLPPPPFAEGTCPPTPAPATPAPPATEAPATMASEPGEGEDEAEPALALETIIAAAVGGSLVLAAAALLAWWWVRGKRAT